MKKLTTVLTLVGVMLLGSLALAQDHQIDPKVRSSVNELLSGIEDNGTRRDFEKLGPDAAAVLREIAMDQKQLVTKRSRAASALSYFEDDASKATLNTLVKSENTPTHLRRYSVHSLVALQGDAALETVGPLLAHEDTRVRESVVRSLVKLKTPKAKALLVQRAKVEKTKHLKSMLDLKLKEMKAL